MRSSHARSLAVVAAAALTFITAACTDEAPRGRETTTAPGSDLAYSEWIDAATTTASPGYTRDADGDLTLQSFRVTSTEGGTRVDLGTSGSTPLGWLVTYAFEVMDAPTHFTIDLSGFTNPHPSLFLGASNSDVSAGTSSTIDTVAGLSVWIDTPVNYRWAIPSPQQLTLEFDGTNSRTAATTSAVRPGPPPPDPWEGMTFHEPSEHITSDDWGHGEDGHELSSIRADDQGDVTTISLRFQRWIPEWEVSYVDVADLPAMDSGIPRQAGLLLTIEGVSGPEDILDGVLVGNDNVDAVLLTEGNTLQVWVGVTAEVPFLVAEDESKIVLVLEN